MRISVFGSTGMAGTAIVKEAPDRGHAVTGVSRITSGDLAIAVVDEIGIPGGERHITVVRTG
ncbi:hypothetical protein [Nocardiopsis alba]